MGRASRDSSGRGRSQTHGPRPEAPRSGLEGRIQKSAIPQRALSAPFCKRNERGIIAANVSFLLCSGPSFDSTLGGDRIDYSRIVFGVHERHWASAKRVATIVEPKGMFADPLVDRPPRDSRIVAAVCATQNVDRRAIQEPVPLELVAHPIIEAKSLQLGGGLTGAPESCPSRRALGAPQDEGDLRCGPAHSARKKRTITREASRPTARV